MIRNTNSRVQSSFNFQGVWHSFLKTVNDPEDSLMCHRIQVESQVFVEVLCFNHVDEAVVVIAWPILLYYRTQRSSPSSEYDTWLSLRVPNCRNGDIFGCLRGLCVFKMKIAVRSSLIMSKCLKIGRDVSFLAFVGLVTNLRLMSFCSSHQSSQMTSYSYF